MTVTSATRRDQRRTISDDQSEVTTASARTTFRRLVFWIVIAAIVLVFVAGVIALTGNPASTARLSATNPKPAGAMALIRVLRTDGVTVTAPRSLTSALKDAGNGGDTTVMLYDPTSILDTTQLRELGNVPNLVLIEPSFDALQTLAPGISAAGATKSSAAPGCTFGPAVRAGAVSGLGRAYRARNTQGGAPITCFGSDGTYSLIRLNDGSSTVTVLGSTTILTNDAITRQGNAALALGLFGEHPKLVWYRPSSADAHVVQDGVIPLPPWVVLMYSLAAIVAVAAIFWRGRRLGPIVVEHLPVIVRSTETVEGRARLYQKASARTHAIDALRQGSLARIAKLCGLPRRAPLDAVVAAAASVSGRSIPEVRALLVDDVPANDSWFVVLSDQLIELEAHVAAATRQM